MVKATIKVLPMAKPSRPSVRLTALQEPTTTKTTQNTKNGPRLMIKFLKNGTSRLVVIYGYKYTKTPTIKAIRTCQKDLATGRDPPMGPDPF